jgi:hypothetical protein
MRSPTREEQRASSPWRNTPPWSVIVFVLAVFFTFASLGFVFDSVDMGRQPPLRFALSVLMVGLFSTSYAVFCISFRKRWWIPILPIFLVENLCMNLVYRWLPDPPALTQLDPAQFNRLQHRLLFDGIAVIASVILGYIGFVVISVSQARRRVLLELDKAALDTELAAAREIQHLMVPEQPPQVPGYAIESIYRPAAQVGGDFFQVIPLEGGQTLVVVGDVSGKGISAAMIVSLLIGMLRTLSRTSRNPAQILAELNGKLFEGRRGGFVTCLAVRLDPAGGVALANAGHLAPWLNGDEIALTGSLPLSLVAAAVPEQAALEMRPGDRLTLITDGVVEARDAEGVLFGFARTQSLLRQEASPLSLAEAARQFGQEDDLTVISILRTA